jgi:DNA-binding CsgD family transcriptional regulator
MLNPDVIGLVEAAYRIADTDQAWLEGVVEAALPVLQRGCGVHAYLVDMSDPENITMRFPMVAGATTEWTKLWRQNWWEPFMEPLDPVTFRVLHTHSVCNYTTDLFTTIAARIPDYAQYLSRLASTRWGRTHPHFLLRGKRPRGSDLIYPDSFNVAALDAERIGCALIANLPDRTSGPVPPDVTHLWSNLAAHLAAGYRLQRRRGVGDPEVNFEGAEAILDPRGRVEHAEGRAQSKAALEAIRATMVAMDQARCKDGRHDPRSALEAWSALTAARWTILDRFDHDGRRYFMARPNESAPPPNAGLTRRQTQILEQVAMGHSNKMIAYELGLSQSTIASHLSAAAKKLGARSALELVGRVQASRFELPT